MAPRRFKTNLQFKLWFGIRRSVLYHDKRQAFCEKCDSWTDMGLLVMGSGVVALAIQHSYLLELIVGIAVALTSALKLKLAFGRRAGTHKQLRLAFIDLQEELEDADEDDVIKKDSRETCELGKKRTSCHASAKRDLPQRTARLDRTRRPQGESARKPVPTLRGESAQL